LIIASSMFFPMEKSHIGHIGLITSPHRAGHSSHPQGYEAFVKWLARLHACLDGRNGVVEFGWVSCVRGWYIYTQIYIQGTCTYMHAYMYVGICMCVCVMYLQEIISHRCVVALMANGGDCWFAIFWSLCSSLFNGWPRVPVFPGHIGDGEQMLLAASQLHCNSKFSMFLVWQHMYTKPQQDPHTHIYIHINIHICMHIVELWFS
jgi:hypothetical protein